MPSPQLINQTIVLPAHPSSNPNMDSDNDIRRLRAEYVSAARRVMEAIRKYGVRSEIFDKASADFEALVERMKSSTGGPQSARKPH